MNGQYLSCCDATSRRLTPQRMDKKGVTNLGCERQSLEAMRLNMLLIGFNARVRRALSFSPSYFKAWLGPSSDKLNDLLLFLLEVPAPACLCARA